MKDYYDILGISKNASDDDIKKAFRKLAHQYHPDKSGGDEKKFKEINEAYQVLSNKEKRSQYDQFGRTFDGAQGFSGNPFGGFDFSGFGGEGFGVDMEDILGSFFGGGKSQGARRKGKDMQAAIEISLEEAFAGTEKKISFKTYVVCDECNGVGYDAKEGTQTCTTCGGTGKIKEQQRSFLGSFVRVRECEECFGTGQKPKKICKACKGQGRTLKEKTVTIKIASGVHNGQIIKVAGGAEAGIRQEKTGDLYVQVLVKSRKNLRIEGDDLVAEHQVSVADLLLGKKFEIESVAGKKISVEIPSGYEITEPIIIRGEGMFRASGMFGGRDQRGNLVVLLRLKTPRKLSKKAKELAEELRSELEKEE